MSIRGSIGQTVVLALLGGLVGSAAYEQFIRGDREPERGTVLRLLGDIDSYYEIDTTPFCVALQHFCLIRVESGEVQALYTYDTLDLMRAQSCEVPWRPEFSFTDPATGEAALGWFRANCSGTTYRYNGERVFGPGPRDMDRFPVTFETEDGVEYLEVDTRRLICGKPAEGAPDGCELAPVPQ